MKKKRVYFAFHYQDVEDFRANVVRNSNVVEGVDGAGYYDCSIWEEAKRTSDLALKRLINKELQGTSVTVVLIGSDTWSRRWVRYEIMKSIDKENKVIGIHINNIKDKNGKIKLKGTNPFDNLGIFKSEDERKIFPVEWNGKGWIPYEELDGFQIPPYWRLIRGSVTQLSQFLPTYDWINDDGYNDFSRWIQ
jgi:hypothetical protein